MARADGNADSSEILFGLHAVREALRAGSRPLLRLIVVRRDGRFAELVRLAQEAGVPVDSRPRPALDRMAPKVRHQGIIGVVGAKTYSNQGEILDGAARRKEAPCVIILDGVEDPHNLGAVLRTAESAGVHGVFLQDRRAAGLTGAVARISAGALEYLRVARVPNLSRLIEGLQAAGLWVYALDQEASKPYTALDLRGPVALVLGGEGRGVRRGVLESCDDRAGIPMKGKVESLNLSVAAGIVMYEVVRQRAG